MNSPTMPGQNSSGLKAAIVAVYDVMIGHDMRVAAKP